MKNRITHECIAAALMPLLLAVTAVSSAAEYNANVRVGVGATDNIARTAQNEIDETITTAGFDFAVTEQTRRMDLDLRSQFDYVDYSDGTFDSEWVGGLNLFANFTLIDERLRWIVQDNLGQALFDPLLPASPGNRENVNFFTTGPTLNLLPASRNLIDIDLRYSRVHYEIRPYDNKRLSGALSVGREISRESTFSLNLRGERTEYDDGELTPPMETYEAYARYETKGNMSTLGFDIGYNEVEYGGNEGDGILIRVNYSRQTSAKGTFTMSGGSRYSDQGNIFRLNNGISNDLRDTSDTTDSPAPFQNDFLALAYALEHERYSVNASIDWNREDYEIGDGDDRDLFRGNLVFRREVTRTVFVGANIGFQRREFKDLARRDDDLTLGLNIGYRVSAGFNISIDYRHFQRNSTSPNSDFTENRAFLRASYTPVWSR